MSCSVISFPNSNKCSVKIWEREDGNDFIQQCFLLV